MHYMLMLTALEKEECAMESGAYSLSGRFNWMSHLTYLGSLGFGVGRVVEG